MKIVVIGGSGLIGKKVVTNLRERGHAVVAALQAQLRSSLNCGIIVA